MILNLVIIRNGYVSCRGGFICNSPKAIIWARKKLNFDSDNDDNDFLGGVLIGLVCWVCNNNWYEPIV